VRVIVAGSRGFTFEDYEIVENACLMSGYWFSTILSGKAEGVDRLGEEFARRMRIPIDPYPADWKRYGNLAGPVRNEMMAKNADALVAVWDGKSRGTEHMIGAARARCLLVHVRIAEPTPLMPRWPNVKGT
jgi:hypothetical protein